MKKVWLIVIISAAVVGIGILLFFMLYKPPVAGYGFEEAGKIINMNHIKVTNDGRQDHAYFTGINENGNGAKSMNSVVTGGYSTVSIPYGIEKHLKVFYQDIIFLQAFKKSDITSSAYTRINGKSYSFNELSQYKLYENNEYNFYDISEPVMGMSLKEYLLKAREKSSDYPGIDWSFAADYYDECIKYVKAID